MITQEHKSIMLRNQQILNEYVKDPDGIARILHSKNVFIGREVEDVRVAKTSADKIERLVDLIKKSDDKAFYAFIDALKETNNKGLADMLENEDKGTRRASYGSGKKEIPVNVVNVCKAFKIIVYM